MGVVGEPAWGVEKCTLSLQRSLGDIELTESPGVSSIRQGVRLDAELSQLIGAFADLHRSPHLFITARRPTPPFSMRRESPSCHRPKWSFSRGRTPRPQNFLQDFEQ